MKLFVSFCDFPSLKYRYLSQDLSYESLNFILFHPDFMWLKVYLSLSKQQRNVFLPLSLRLAQSAAPNDCVTSSELRRIRLFICIDQILVKN